LVAVARIPSLDLGGLVLTADPLVAVVEGVEKPGNIGAILRSADGAAIDAVVAASPRTDLFNPNAIRASAGTIFAIRIAAAPTADVLAWLRDRRIRVVAARVDATQRYTEVDLTGPLALVVGAEAEGLGDAWSADDVSAVRLPMLGVGDSLNVSVSAAILFYEARRQRGDPSRTSRG
jgi:TrmH family RNA methyltransferase